MTKNNFFKARILLCVCALALLLSGCKDDFRYTGYVDPFIGSGGQGWSEG